MFLVEIIFFNADFTRLPLREIIQLTCTVFQTHVYTLPSLSQIKFTAQTNPAFIKLSVRIRFKMKIGRCVTKSVSTARHDKVKFQKWKYKNLETFNLRRKYKTKSLKATAGRI
jgi:hypothetical protein